MHLLIFFLFVIEMFDANDYIPLKLSRSIFFYMSLTKMIYESLLFQCKSLFVLQIY